MRPIHVTLPIGLLLAAAGAGMMAFSMRSGERILSGPRHPVTPEMWRKADAMAGYPAPELHVADAKGATHTIASLTAGRPAFVYFILDGCPCSIDAEPLLQRLHKHHKGEVRFLGVIKGGDDMARKWANDWSSPYPIASSTGEAMKAYAVDRSVYSVLIGKDGRIERMWPGFSAAMLVDANEAMARLTGKAAQPFDPLYAPKEMTSGCSFADGS